MSEDIVKSILKLKREKNALIFSHNYQLPEVQDIADCLGDSLELSLRGSRTDAGIIVFCGVYFMAETASILCPGKKVLLPAADAGCPMAEMITVQALLSEKEKHPGALVVSYVNTTAAVKAESDYCVTSANALRIVQSLPKEKEIIFIPDKYLGSYVMKMTARKLYFMDGYCPSHVKITLRDIQKAREAHPEARVLAHPECLPEVLEAADIVASTSGMCRAAQEKDCMEFILATEVGILHRLRRENPGKKFYPASDLALCPNMKRITLDKILHALEEEDCEVRVPEDIRKRALLPLQRMLEKN
ncbi:MAG: quinolinate synthase NadA [bacterium]